MNVWLHKQVMIKLAANGRGVRKSGWTSGYVSALSASRRLAWHALMPAPTSQKPVFAHSLPHRVFDFCLHALLERVHDVDDLRRLAFGRLDLDLWRTLLDLRLHKLVHGVGVFIRHLLRLELA